MKNQILNYNDEDYEYIVNLNPGVDCIIYGKGDKRIYCYHPNTSQEKIFEEFQGEKYLFKPESLKS